ncbi:MAG: RDD family protein [Alphaproteobacteria bacterium]|nr:RDD family protein [Alphaproteobacteria bacterium]
MMASSTLPVPANRIGASWFGAMPEWLDRPEHFRGLGWRRVAAYLTDLIVLVPLGFAVNVVFGTLTILSFGLLAHVWVAAVAAVPLVYHTLTIGGRHASTWGMRLFDVEMRSWTGERPEYFQALLTTLLFYASVAVTGGLILLLGILNRRRRLAHDLFSGMVAVRASALDDAELIPPGEASGPHRHA